MPGAPDPLYVAARQVLLDALHALREHLDSIVLVGAQAVYIHAGEADVAIAPFTTDGDLAIDPRHLAPQPLMEVALGGAGFRLVDNAVGTWEVSVEINGIVTPVGIDLLVPESLGGAGRRGARIAPHARTVARKASGLEATLVDRELHTITALDPADHRRFELAVAGPAALIVAKVHKILDRVDDKDRISEKDALDVYRLLRVASTEDLGRKFAVLLGDGLSRVVSERTLAELPRLFGSSTAAGSQMAARAAGSVESGATIGASIAVLTRDLVLQLRGL